MIFVIVVVWERKYYANVTCHKQQIHQKGRLKLPQADFHPMFSIFFFVINFMSTVFHAVLWQASSAVQVVSIQMRKDVLFVSTEQHLLLENSEFKGKRLSWQPESATEKTTSGSPETCLNATIHPCVSQVHPDRPLADLQLKRHRIWRPNVCDTSGPLSCPVVMNALFVEAVWGHSVGGQLLFLFVLRMTGRQDSLWQ